MFRHPPTSTPFPSTTLSRSLTAPWGTPTARPLAGMPMDAYRVGDNFVAHFDLPGVDPGSIDLQVEGTTLTISAERSVPQIENAQWRSEEHTSELQSRQYLVCRLLLEKKKPSRPFAS